jgi:hypothetical protein
MDGKNGHWIASSNPRAAHQKEPFAEAMEGDIPKSSVIAELVFRAEVS